MRIVQSVIPREFIFDLPGELCDLREILGIIIKGYVSGIILAALGECDEASPGEVELYEHTSKIALVCRRDCLTHPCCQVLNRFSCCKYFTDSPNLGCLAIDILSSSPSP